MAKLTLTIYGVITNRMPLQKTDVSISVGDDVINGELSKRMPLLQRDLSSKDAKWEKGGAMDVNFSLSLGTFQLQQKMYSPHEIEAEILITPTNIDRTTQKVNLYEKMQIPGYQEAIRKIKRYMEDEENLSKASSKIVKTRHAAEEEEESL